MPPADAFNNVRRFPAPAWQQQQEAQARRQAAAQALQAGKKGKKRRKGGNNQAQKQKPGKPRKQKQVNPARRRRQRRIAAVLAIVALIALGAWFSITVLFKINKYEIQGDVTVYSEEEIMDAFGHALGDNLYGFSVTGAEERLTTRLPYIEVADIRRRPPSTVVFKLTMAQEAYYLPWEGAYVVLNADGKALRTTGEAPPGVVRVDGLSCLVVEPGYPIRLDEKAVETAVEEKAALEAAASASAASLSDGSGASDASASVSSEVSSDSSSESASDSSLTEGGSSLPEEGEPEPTPQPQAVAADPALAGESFAVLWELIDALEQSGLEGIVWIDVSDPLALRFNWQDRMTVELGPKSGMDEKMKALVVLLRDHLEETDRGTVDLTLYLTTGECIYTPE